MHEYTEATEHCLREMFSRVGERYPNPKLTKYRNWFELRTWTEEEENDFRTWMKTYLKKKCRWNNRTIQREIEMFLLMWGWKTELTKKGGEHGRHKKEVKTVQKSKVRETASEDRGKQKESQSKTYKGEPK